MKHEWWDTDTWLGCDYVITISATLEYIPSNFHAAVLSSEWVVE
ncbi:hypothetical protein [Ehrlichia canis]|nr:hypothetical protein [Ehrlichia canis]